MVLLQFGSLIMPIGPIMALDNTHKTAINAFIFHTHYNFFTIATIFSTVLCMCKDFHNNFSDKIFALWCVVCKSLQCTIRGDQINVPTTNRCSATVYLNLNPPDHQSKLTIFPSTSTNVWAIIRGLVSGAWKRLRPRTMLAWKNTLLSKLRWPGSMHMSDAVPCQAPQMASSPVSTTSNLILLGLVDLILDCWPSRVIGKSPQWTSGSWFQTTPRIFGSVLQIVSNILFRGLKIKLQSISFLPLTVSKQRGYIKSRSLWSTEFTSDAMVCVVLLGFTSFFCVNCWQGYLQSKHF